MSDHPSGPVRPSPSELQFLKLLWRQKRLSAREIHDATADQTGWSYSATRKTLDRMVDKNLLSTKPVHGIKTFAAAVGKVAIIGRLIQDFAKNVLEADGPLPTAAFAHSRILDESDLDALEAWLEDAEDEDPDQ